MLRHGTIFGASSLLLVALAAYGQDSKPAWMKKGKLQDVAEHVRTLLPLTVDKGNLVIDRRQWDNSGEKPKEDPNAGVVGPGAAVVIRGGFRSVETGPLGGAARAFMAIQSMAGNMTSSSMGGGGNNMSRSFSSSELEGRLGIQGGAVRIMLREVNAPGRTIDVSDDGDGTFRMTVSDGPGETLLMISCTAGRFRVVQINGEQAQARTATNFLQFYRANRTLVDGEIVPLLEYLGVAPPMLQYSPKVRAAVLSELRGPVTDEERKQIDALIAQLSDDAYARREEAVKELTARGDRHRERLDKAAADERLPAEASDRLKKLLEKLGPPDKARSVVTELKLTEDVPYLVEMMQSAAAADQQVVGQRLEKLTGLKLGDDPAVWRKWPTAQPATRPAQ